MKKKISNNKSSIRQTGGGPSEYSDLTPLEQSVENICNTSVAANPSGNIFGLNVLSTSQVLPPNPREDVLSSSMIEALPNSQVETILSSPVEVIASSGEVENIVLELQTPSTSTKTYSANVENETPNIAKKSTIRPRQRRLQTKQEERTKLIKLTEQQTEEMKKMTVALELLTEAVKAQTKILEQNKNDSVI